jgi:hypothetical protein
MTKPRNASLGRNKPRIFHSLSERQAKRRSWPRRLFGWLLIFIICTVLVTIGSILIIPDRAQKIKESASTVTIQVLDGSGIGNVADAMIGALKDNAGSLLFEIAESANTSRYSFDETILIDRCGSGKGDGKISEKAKLVAQRLGIEPQKVLLMRYEENIKNIELTLIAGRDYRKYLEKLNQAKEASL